MRGRGCVGFHHRVVFGITPACAGKRPAGRSCPAGPGDHPRVCGEEVRLAANSDMPKGSPPRVRGRVFDIGACNRWDGITPACAGKRHLKASMSLAGEDHPRVCGEEKFPKRVLNPSKGSPPRVRGRDAGHQALGLLVRITPACAGKSACSTFFFSASKDHPRVCGEEANGVEWLVIAEGSPPRVRGRVIILLFNSFR